MAEASEGLSPKKVRDAVSAISLVMKCAIRGGGRRDNPAADHHIPVPPAQAAARRCARHRTANRPEQGPYTPAVWLLAYTGLTLRPAELCGLRVGSVDLVRRVIRVTESLMPVHRYADARYVLVEGPPKTAAGTETSPSPSGCAASWPRCSPTEQIPEAGRWPATSTSSCGPAVCR